MIFKFSPLRRSDDAASSDCQPESLGCMVADQTDTPSLSAQTPISTAHPKALTTEAIVGILGIVGILLIAIVAFFAIICGCGCKCMRGKKKPTRRNVRVQPGMPRPRKAESVASSSNLTPDMKHANNSSTSFDVERNESKVNPSPKASTWDLRFVKLGHGISG